MKSGSAKWRLVVDIYEKAVGMPSEGGYPVVRHAFYGKTKKECRGYFSAHMGTDAFMSGCVDKGAWETVSCKSFWFWEKL